MKRLLTILLITIAPPLMAQTPQVEYALWKQQTMGEYTQFCQRQAEVYAAFRRKANEEYAAFVEQAWANVRPNAPMRRPAEPKPITPPVAPADAPLPSPTPIPHEEVAPIATPEPVPDAPIAEPHEPSLPTISIDYYGTPVSLRSGTAFKLSSTKRKPIATAWKTLSAGGYEALLYDCQQVKQSLALGDWGYIRLTQMAADGITSQRSNEAVLLWHWLLAQSGYSSRLAVSGQGQLQLWMPFDALVFDHPYLVLDSVPYFLLSHNDTTDNDLQVLPHGFKGEHMASLRMMRHPKLSIATCPSRTFRSEQGMTAIVAVNRNLIRYYNDYPRIAGSWDMYAAASLSKEIKRQLYPQLQEQIASIDKVAAAERLLRWVQTAFAYHTDEEQFGSERSLFADESLYYPYCDCEDRSILYSILVHDLLGLDVALLHFPGHLATAVKFDTAVDGDYLELNDGHYVVCDPTYIGAPVGLAMPDCKQRGIEINVYPIRWQ